MRKEFSNAKETRIYLTDPSNEELLEISEKCGIDINNLKSSLDLNALARIYFNDITSMFVDIPFHTKSKQLRIKTTPVGFFIKDNYFVAVSFRNLDIITEAFSDKKSQSISGAELLLYLLYKISLLYIENLTHIDKETERLENQMKKRVNNNGIFQLMEYQRSLTAMTTSLKGVNRLLARIKEKGFCSEQQELMEDVEVAAQQASEMADIFNADLDALMDGFGSVISNSVNEIMKILTSLTLIIAIPTLVAGIYGMNVSLPFEKDPFAFYYICGGCGIISLITGIVFYLKKML